MVLFHDFLYLIHFRIKGHIFRKDLHGMSQTRMEDLKSPTSMIDGNKEIFLVLNAMKKIVLILIKPETMGQEKIVHFGMMTLLDRMNGASHRDHHWMKEHYHHEISHLVCQTMIGN